jgi:hypothetical protein
MGAARARWDRRRMAYLRPTVRQLQPLGRRNPHLAVTARRRAEAGRAKVALDEPHLARARH